jgi:2',3'-cyclic-nucleotide 2'-phosphodiesterase (5'-nucleotidase family)
MAASAVSFLQPLNVFAGNGAELPMPAGSNMLTILHTANIKGQWSAIGQNEKLAGLGGLQNITKKIGDIKKETHSVVVIDAGNLLSEQRQTKEERLHFYQKVTNAGYDVAIPGSADLAFGAKCFKELAIESVLNIVGDDNTIIIDAALPYSIVKKSNTRIGIINAGATTLKTSGNTTTYNAAGALNQTAHLLRTSKNCTFIICIVQSSDRKCLKIAGLSSGVDVLVSTVEKDSIHNTQIVRNKSNHEVILSYAGAKGAMMSRIDLTFNDKGEKINVASKAIFAGAADESYASILKKCAAYNA